MGRFAPAQATSGTVKSIQHFTQTIGSNGNYTISMTAVDTNKSVINGTGGFAHYAGAAGNDVRDRSGGASGGARVGFSSSTSLNVVVNNLDIFNYNFGGLNGYWAGTVVEYS